MATVYGPGEKHGQAHILTYGESIYVSPNPNCSTQQKVFEKCDKVLPTSICFEVSGLQKCHQQQNIDCILRKKEFEECLKNGCSPSWCNWRTHYLTLCVTK